MSREFAELKPRDRALLWLAYVEEHNHQEIASALGLARGSVKVLLSRARCALCGKLIWSPGDDMTVEGMMRRRGSIATHRMTTSRSSSST